MDEDLAAVVRRELALLEPAVRRSPDDVRALLHPDFIEYGASGRTWNRDSVTTATAESGPPVEAHARQLNHRGPEPSRFRASVVQRFRRAAQAACSARRTLGPPVVMRTSLSTCAGAFFGVVWASQPLGSDRRITLCPALATCLYS